MITQRALDITTGSIAIIVRQEKLEIMIDVNAKAMIAINS
jgi:hypothetical protein